MENIIIIAVLVIILGFAAGYVIKSKKMGKKCIGCPASKTCSKNCCFCSEDNENK